MGYVFNPLSGNFDVTLSDVGTLDAKTANSTGLTIDANVLYAQSASATMPGLVNTTTQSFAGDKTFTGSIINPSTVIGASGVEVIDTGTFSFSSTSSASGTPDTAIGRTSAGLLEVNNGTSGVLRDIKTRSHILVDTTLAASGSLTGSVLDISQTWNTTGAPSGIKYTITDTASASTSLALQIQGGAAGTTNLAKLDKNGMLTLGGAGFSNNFGLITQGGISVGTGASSVAGDQIQVYSGAVNVASMNTNGFRAKNTGGFAWSSTGVSGGTLDTYLTRPAAATVQLGDAASATPVDQTLRAQGSRSGTDTNVSGADLTITSGIGTGSSTPSAVYINSPSAVASGTGAQTLPAAPTLSVYNQKVGVGIAAPTAPFHVVTPNNNIFRFNDGNANNTPYIGIGSSTAKAVALLTGASGSTLTFDDTGFFGIYKDGKAAIDGGTSAGGTSLVRVSNSGNFGINTTNPLTKLHVVDGAGELKFQNVSQANLYVSGTNASINIDSINGVYPGLFLKQSGVPTSQWGNSGTETIFAASGNITFAPNTGSLSGTVRAVITGTGFLGVGQASASVPLDILKSASGYIAKFSDGTQICQIFTSAGFVGLGTTSATTDWRFFVDNNSARGITIKNTTGFFGVNNTAPTSQLHVTGSVQYSVAALTTATTLGSTNYFVTADATSAAFAITLPAASASIVGRVYEIKKIDSSANAVTITAAGANTIDGLATIPITTQYRAFKLVCISSTAWGIF